MASDDSSWLRRITRRDFLQGVLVGAGAVALGPGISGCAAHGRRTATLAGNGGHLDGERFRVCHGFLTDDSAGSGGATTAAETGTREPGEVAVAIVGAGLSGLAAAWALAKRGVDDFVLFDKEPVSGGHARALAIEGRRAAAGAAYSLTPWGELLTDFYRAIEVIPPGASEPAAEFLVPEPANRSFIGGEWVDDSWGEGMDRLPVLHEDRRALRRLREAIRGFGSMTTGDGRLAFDVPSDASTTDPRVRALDRVSFAQWIEGELRLSQGATAFFEPYCRSALGMTAAEVSAWSAVGFLQAEWEPTLTRPGGTAFLAERLLERVGPSRVRLGRTVVRISRDGDDDGVLITSVDASGADPRTQRARTAIVAAPKYVARHLVADAPAPLRAAWERFNYRPYIVANLALDALDAGLGYDNWLHGPRGRVDRGGGGGGGLVTDFIVADAQARRGRGGEPGVLTAYCPVLPPLTRGQVLSEPFEVWAERVVASMSPAVPGLRERLVALDLFRWGHALIESPPGFVFGEARAEALRPVGNIHFAHTDLDGVPAVESAVAQGVRAADEVARALRQGAARTR